MWKHISKALFPPGLPPYQGAKCKSDCLSQRSVYHVLSSLETKLELEQMPERSWPEQRYTCLRSVTKKLEGQLPSGPWIITRGPRYLGLFTEVWKSDIGASKHDNCSQKVKDISGSLLYQHQLQRSLSQDLLLINLFALLFCTLGILQPKTLSPVLECCNKQ